MQNTTTKTSNCLFSKTRERLPIINVGPTAQATKPSNVLSIPTFRLQDTAPEEIILFGMERQKEFGKLLDSILAEITKGTSPLLFELFSELSRGVKDVDIPELEKEIKAASEHGGFGGFLVKIGLGSAADRLKKANEKIGSMLTAKSTSLLDLCKKLEDRTNTEVVSLIQNSKKLYQLAQGLRENINSFDEYVKVGKHILETEKELYARLQAEAGSDMTKVNEVKQFEDKLTLFENRMLVLENALVKAPKELETIRIGLKASFDTISETANSTTEDMNDIKSVLIRLSVIHQTKTVQGLNAHRQALKAGLSGYADQELENTALAATQAQGMNRLNDATALLESAKRLEITNQKLKEEAQKNVQRREEARQKLLEVKGILTK